MRSTIILFLLCCFCSLAGAETVFKIHDGKAWRDFDSNEWEKLPRTEVKAMARDKTERTFSGVPFAEILKLIPAPSGNTLRGPELAKVILITAADGYQVSFSIAELDASFKKQNVIIADSVDGKPLSEFEGKRMLVCGDELRHPRWIRQITSISLMHPVMPKE